MTYTTEAILICSGQQFIEKNSVLCVYVLSYGVIERVRVTCERLRTLCTMHNLATDNDEENQTSSTLNIGKADSTRVWAEIYRLQHLIN